MSGTDDFDDEFFDNIFDELELDDSIFEDSEQKAKPKATKEFVVNDYITLRLENDQTNIYVDGNLFKQCKHLLFDIPTKNIEDYDEINSIDEAVEVYNEIANNIYPFGAEISPETEFIGHCSNLQAWYENNYDTRILHSNIAFPLLKKLYEAGDKIAKQVFAEQVLERFLTGSRTTVTFLIEGNYSRFLEKKDRMTLIEDPNSQLIEILFEIIKRGKGDNRINTIIFFLRCGTK